MQSSHETRRGRSGSRQPRRTASEDSSAGIAVSRLDSGLTVISELVPDARSVSIGFWFDVGSRDETPETNGIAHFIEHAVFKGTRRRKTHHIARYLESVGGYVNAFTGKYTTCFYARVLDRHLGRAVDLLSDLVLRPLFDEKEIAKERQVVAEEMRSIEDDPEDIINDEFEHLLFGNHPLGRPIIGRAENLRNFDGAALSSFVRSEYTSGNLVVAAAGNVEHDRLADLCGRTLETLPRGGRRKRRGPRRKAPRQIELHKPAQQTHLIMGCRTPGLRRSDSDTLMILNTLLGEGMGSRLFQRVRERHGYTYNIYSFINPYEDVGTFGVYTSAENGSIERCGDLIRRELDELATHPISPRELARTREQLIGGLILGLESMNARMSRLGKDFLLYGRVLKLEDSISRLNSVTAEDILRVAGYACDHGNYTSVLIKPA